MPYKIVALQLYANFPKSYSSLLTQILTGKIGLAAFLHQHHIPSVKLPACLCGW